MYSYKKLDLDLLSKNGYYNYRSFFNLNFTEKLKDKCDVIYHSEKFLNKFGLGNCSYRNGSSFSGNLLIKSNVFIELALRLQKFLESNNLSNYFLSEFFLVSNNRSNNFSEWWHRDFPHTSENFKLFTNHSIGFFIPVSEFNHQTGATKLIEFSHNDLSLTSKSNPKSLSAEKGDLIIYNPKILHTGGLNNSKNTRNLIIAIFNRKEFIPCEDFQIQLDYIFSKHDKKLIKNLNLIRYKGMQNFFGRNRSIINTSLKPFIKIIKKFISVSQNLKRLFYFAWTRFLYLIFSLLINNDLIKK